MLLVKPPCLLFLETGEEWNPFPLPALTLKSSQEMESCPGEAIRDLPLANTFASHGALDWFRFVEDLNKVAILKVCLKRKNRNCE